MFFCPLAASAAEFDYAGTQACRALRDDHSRHKKLAFLAGGQNSYGTALLGAKPDSP